MLRFASFLSLPLALSTACFNPSGNGTASDASTGSGASSTSTTGSTTAPTTGTSTDATTQSATVSSTDPDTTTLLGTTDLTTTIDLTGTTAITDTTLTTLDTTGVLPTCGDGSMDIGEECDDGNDIDDDACSNTCVTAKCGDGVVNQPSETCDDGNDINDDGCTILCKEPTCGDGFVQAGVEECDDGNEDEGDGCLGCKTEGLTVFVTADTRTTIEVQPVLSDAHCNAAGQAQFPNRTFVAWVSTKGNAVKGRLGMDKGRRYVLGKSDTVVADNYAQLLSGSLKVAINVDENNMTFPLAAETDACDESPNYVWTGTNGDGTGTNSDCNGWTVGMVGTGTVGTLSAKDFKWTNKCTRSCAEAYRIICVQKEL